MVNKNFTKATSCLIAGVVGATLIGSNNVLVLAETTLVHTTIDAGAGSQTQTPIPAKQRVSVHDPSIVKDTVNNEYYVFGSHIEAAKSKDLQNWTSFANGYAKTDNVLFGNLSENLAGSFAWAGENDSDSKGGFSVWAPSVIWNPTYDNGDGTKGAYLMYYCTSSTYKRSAIGYAASKTIEGPYKYVDTIMYSGFTNKDATDANSTINTNVKTLIDKGEIPADTNSKWFNADGSYNTSYAPNAIDPELFYDKNGKLWMNYGSWSGGIYILEIDQTTGKPIYPGTSEETDSSSSVNYTDRFFGKHIAGGFTQSGEGAEIVYDSANGYYYLYMTYAGLAANGGYNMRLFRSTSPTGPFLDAKGQNAAWSKTADNIDYGIKLIGNYKFNCLDVGYKSAGHNSSFIDSDGKMYLIYHQRFDDGTENHQVRVHQMFLNKEGWPVVAPYENSGDDISPTGYSDSEIIGNYQFINHGHTSSASMLNTLNIRLNSDRTISGDITGTWSKDDSNYYMNAVIDGVTYSGIFFKQQDESKYENKVMTFSAVGNNNEVIWGSKLELSDDDAISYITNVLNNKIPSNTKTDLSLPTSGAYDTQISWSSSDPAVLSNDGKVTRPKNENKEITLTATITAKGGKTSTQTFTILVKGELDFTGVPIYKYNFSTVDGTSITNSGSKGVNSSASATLKGTSQIVNDAERNQVLEIKNAKGALSTNYLALPNNTFNAINEKGYTVGMWVNIDKEDPAYFEHSALFEADKSKTFPMTRLGANLIGRINSNGSYADTDKATLQSKTWQYVTYTVNTKGIVVYVNGAEVGRQDKDITSSLSNTALSTINNVRIGSGDIWNDADIGSAKFDNIAFYNTALTDQEVEGLYKNELSGNTDTTVTDQQSADFAANELADVIPSSTKTNLTLPTTGSYDSTIQWSSSEPDILNIDGTVIRPEGANKQVTLTAKITKGSATPVEKTFTITVLGVLNSYNATPSHRYNFNANDTSNSLSGNGDATIQGTASIVPDETRGNVLQINNTGGTKVNYLALPSDTFKGITNKGLTVSMWVNVNASAPGYLEGSALFEANGGGKLVYPMIRISANLLARINDGKGGWIDTAATGLPSNTWQYVTYTIDPSGLSVYLNGKEVSRVNKDISSSFENDILAGMTDVRVGSGNIFGDSDLASAKFDNVTVFKTSLTGQQVEALYNKELNSSNPVEGEITSIVTTPASVTLTPGNTAQLTATVNSLGEVDKTVTWSSNDTNNKVTVDQNGLVSVTSDAALGDYEITATSTEDSSKSGTTNIKIVSSSEEPNNNDNNINITKQPIDLKIKKGRTATFSVQASGASLLSYQWRRNSTELIDNENIKGANTSKLIIENVSSKDTGLYDCIIADEFENVTTSSAAKLSLGSSSSSSSSSNSSSSSSNSSTQTNTSTANGTVIVNTNGASIQDAINAIKNSTEKTIIITLPTPDQSSATNNVPILNQDIITSLKTNLDKTLVIKATDSTIEIKGKDGQLQFTQNSLPLTGFKTIGQTEYYLDSNGIMQTGWVQTSDSSWYYLDKATGAKKSNWIQETNGTWYYLDNTSGVMKTGWVKETNNTWYYLDKTSGSMKTGWVNDNDQWYYLNSNGSLATSTIIDGYTVDENGRWIK